MFTSKPTSKRGAMTQALLLGLTLLFLSACGSLPERGVSSESDLDVLVMGVEEMAVEREPASDVKRAEDVQTTGEGWSLLLALEDVDWLHEDDKARIVRFVKRATDRIREARNPPCSLWERLTRRRECPQPRASGEGAGG